MMILCCLTSPSPLLQDCAVEVALLREKQAALENKVSELKQQLETEMKVQCGHILLIHLQNIHFLFL